MKKITLIALALVTVCTVLAQSPLLDKKKYDKAVSKIEFKATGYTVKGEAISTVRLSEASHNLLKDTKVSDLQVLYSQILELEKKMEKNRSEVTSNTPEELRYKAGTKDYVKPALSNPVIYYNKLREVFSEEQVGAYMSEYKKYNKIAKDYNTYIAQQ